jgi:neurotransmitter:Na+ symporter, NSS family
MRTQREHWGTRLGFLLATAGSAIGLGSLWKFPYVAGDSGGGLFLLMYLLCTFLVAVPLFIGELLVGRNTQLSPVGAIAALSRQTSAWRLLGWLCVFTNFIILSYYSVVAGWALNYTLMSLNQFTEGLSADQIQALFGTMVQAGDLNVLWFAAFLAISVAVVYKGIRAGIEYWSRILMPALLVLLLGLFVYSTTLDGFGQAVRFILLPDFSKFSAIALLKALGLSFFTLSVGLGILITYGSYMRPTESLARSAGVVASLTVGTSIFASLMIFPIIFTFGFSPQMGTGLLFKTMPVLFAQLPGTLVLSTAFFLLVVFTALTSAISILEVLVATIMELLKWHRPRAIWAVAAGVFILGLPSALAHSGGLFPQWTALYGRNFFDTFDYLVDTWLLPVNGLLMALFIGWIVDRAIRREEFVKGAKGVWLYRPWIFLLKWLSPLAICLILLNQVGVIG